MLQDDSRQANLEQKVQTLNAIASIDPLTKVANRAELTRQLPKFLDGHFEEGRSGSLIICDIDFFKKINDTYGHQAGDDALVTFAALLKETAREEDLVARFGGEEFVILCAGCDNAAASHRAEQMRKAVESTPVPSLEGRNMTSSFGVTELQRGDNDQTFLARADRALLMAKETGRNRVVQLGAGQDLPLEQVAPKSSDAKQNQKNGWMGWFSGAGETIASANYLASVPQEVAVQKLEGFINDHDAELVSTEDSEIKIRVNSTAGSIRRGERPTSMLMNINMTKVNVPSGKVGNTAYQSRTKFQVTVQPYRARDRRSESLAGQANQLLVSFQSYLVAQEIDDEMRKLIIDPR